MSFFSGTILITCESISSTYVILSEQRQQDHYIDSVGNFHLWCLAKRPNDFVHKHIITFTLRKFNSEIVYIFRSFRSESICLEINLVTLGDTECIIPEYFIAHKLVLSIYQFFQDRSSNRHLNKLWMKLTVVTERKIIL
uniref:Uncharacterized protein n=1 Tax=Onchocerca volvulus TaxID=6282 RepID=A0A8R1U045_ONCVO